MADPAAVPSSFGLSKSTLIHIACEALLIAVSFFILNRKISAQRSDLIECAVRIASQNKRISELEDRLQELTDKVGALSMNVSSLSAPKPRMPFPFMEQPVWAPAPAAPAAAPVTPAPTPVPEAVQPFPVVHQQQPTVESFQPFPGSQPTAAADAPSGDALDREIASELGELTAAPAASQ